METQRKAAKATCSGAQRFLATPPGKKVVMAVTGLVFLGFLVGHLLGNAQVFLGPTKLDEYARFLHANPALLWGTRAVLLVSLVLHVTTAVQLELLKGRARAIPYQHVKDWRSASIASRTMIWSGAALLLFVVYHLLHLTFGVSAVHASFEEGRVSHNVIAGLHAPVAVLVYLVAMGLLALHLQHGLWSMFQSVGLGRRPTAARRLTATVVAVLLAAGFAAIPLAIVAGALVER